MEQADEKAKPNWNGEIYEVVRYLNEKTGSAFHKTSASTRRPIIARLNEGFTVAEFRAVIDEKTRQWLGDETFGRYLRPQTLFGGKMESYLQEARRYTRPGPHAAGFRDAKELLG